jgi:hypothetical protein
MLQPVAVQMFRVLVNTEGAAQAGGMFPGGGDGGDGGGGYGQPLDPLQPVTPVPPPPPPDAGAEDGTGVQQYHAVCTSADVASCVPPCNAEHHGYELLATIDGTDTKFSCNLAHGLYSWMGAASEGGYLGADAQSFFSAVVSGAAGSYIVTLTEDAGISTDLVIQPGQDVHITGSGGSLPSNWGSGGFTVQQGGSVSLANVAVAGSITVQDGGTSSVNGGTLGGLVSVMAGATLTLAPTVATTSGFGLTVAANGIYSGPESIIVHDAQCYEPYTTLYDAWRAVTNGAGDHHDSPPLLAQGGVAGGVTGGTGVGGGAWYRFAGSGGDAMPLAPPWDGSGSQPLGHCGADGQRGLPGWLSGWAGDAGERPPNSCTVPGHYPTAADGVVDMTVCFDHSYQSIALQCMKHAIAGVVNCGDYLLWRLEYAPDGGVYCTEASGLEVNGRRLAENATNALV